MESYPVSRFRDQLPTAMEKAKSEPIAIERYGEVAAVLLSPEMFEELVEAAEELDDIRSFDEAMAEEGDSIPWDDVKSQLGW